MGILKGLKDAQPNSKDPFFLPGNYKVQIAGVKLWESKKDNSDLFIIRGKLVESDNPELKPGTVCSQVIKISGNASALGNIKAFVAAALGVDRDDEEAMAEIDEESVLQAIKEDSFVGLVLGLRCSQVKTKKGGDFTVHNWSNLEEPPAS